MESSKRIPLIDEIRGLSIVLMVIYHFFYDLVIIFNVNIELFFSDFINSLVMLFAGTFIFISGCSSNFSRSNIKRGAICFGFGVIVTAVTAFIMPAQLDLFGILHMLGISMMLFPLFEPLIKKIPPLWGMLGTAALFLLCFNIPNGYIGSFGIRLIELPTQLYSTSFLFPIGLPGPAFRSSDYFPLIPWLLCFLCGSFFGKTLASHKAPDFFYSSHFKPLAFVGRHTMLIYLLHQPILYGLLLVIFNLI